MKASLPSVAILLVSLLVILLALDNISLPESRPESSDPALFSSGRAMKHLRVIAAEPRFVGSIAHRKTKEYLLEQLRQLGLEPMIQKSVVYSASRVAFIENIIAIIRGSANTKAILLAAHYDTVPLAPGANDDGSGVVAILETIRALRHHPPLKNDLIILFSDAEEMGMVGARAFMAESPLADSVGLIMNFEARGSSGPSIMFETNDENGWVVREFDRVVRSKFAGSLLYELYRLLPNNTDFTILKRKGASGLNFAHANTAIDYHTVQDNLNHVDERTIQHHGENMLTCTLHFGNCDLRATRSTNLVYFSFLFGSFIMYPVPWSIPLVCLTTALFGLVLFLGMKKNILSLKRIGLGFLIIIVRIALAAGMIFGLWRLLGPLHPEYKLFYLDSIYQAELYLAAFLSLAIVIAVLLHHRFEKTIGGLNLAVGAALLWLLSGWVLTLFAPAASYLLLWPLTFTLAGYLILLLGKLDGRHSAWIVIGFVFTMVPGLFIGAQLLYLLYHMMTLFAAAALAGLVVLFLGLLQLQISILTDYRPWLIPTIGFSVAVLCILLALYSRSSDQHHPKPNSLIYAADLDNQSAVWITRDEELDEWTGQSINTSVEHVPLPRYFPFTKGALISGTAPYIRLAGAEAGIVSQQVHDSVRVLRIRIQVPEHTSILVIEAETPENIQRVEVNNHLLDSLSQRGSTRWPKNFFGRNEAGIDLTLTVRRGAELGMRLFTVSGTMPEVVRALFPARPDWMIPRPAPLVTDVAVVGKTMRY